MLKELLKGCRRRRREDQKELYEMFYAYGMSITLRYADSREGAVDMLKTTSQFHNEQFIMANNRDSFEKGEFRFGFNIHRNFGL